MTNADAQTKAKATMHIKVMRKDGRVEEFDVPVSTDMTKEQVLALIAGQQGACGAPSDIEAHAGTGNFLPVCEAHLGTLRESAHAAGLIVTARRSARPGLCTTRED